STISERVLYFNSSVTRMALATTESLGSSKRSSSPNLSSAQAPRVRYWILESFTPVMKRLPCRSGMNSAPYSKLMHSKSFSITSCRISSLSLLLKVNASDVLTFIRLLPFLSCIDRNTYSGSPRCPFLYRMRGTFVRLPTQWFHQSQLLDAHPSR